MTIRLYFDEDSMRHALAQALRARGMDVVTALEAGMMERADAEHLDYATSQERALFSFNVQDFYQLHTTYMHTLASFLRASKPTLWASLCAASCASPPPKRPNKSRTPSSF